MATNVPQEKAPVKVRIYEVAGMGLVQDALGLGNSGIAGFYDSNIFGPFLVTPRNADVDDRYVTPELVLNHEYAHHFMLQYFPAIYPSWYVEGFAELVGSSKQLPNGRIGYGMPAKHRGNEIAAYWVPLQELLVKERVRDLDRYGQGWALTHFFTFDSKRSAQLRQYLSALRAGKSFKEAAQVFGDLNALNREARRYVTTGVFDYKPVKVEIARPVIRNMRRLSAGEAALIPEVIAFRDDDLSLIKKPAWRERERRLREGNLRKIREKAARYPNDAFALYLLAEAENAAGNLAQSDAAIDRLLALQPGHVRAMARKSLNLSRAASRLQGTDMAAKASAARRLAVRANRADPNDPLPLIAFFESFRLAGQKPTPLALEGLMQAVTTLSQDLAIRQLLVDQLAGDQRYAEAIAWLLPIANSPHDSPRRDAAREQMARLQAALARQRGTSGGAKTTS
ncbi:hypothetical protein [Sphingomonas sp.]|uniref:hypothetical protein n=1 Tax=Sphingomonas sp. TaxID=28214 RepID=UPI0017F7BCF7|nr:hypothetical protein [Sphingomonas sp.]MBA3512458.1 hypothetical protein [Sphingomonas sp.]